MAYVYFIKHNKMSPIKIGHTTQSDVMTRVNEFKTASPYGIELIATIETFDPAGIEREIHEDLKDYRLEGEWFDIDLDMVSRVVGRYPYKYCQKHRIKCDIPYSFDYQSESVERLEIFRQFHYQFAYVQDFSFKLIKKCVMDGIGKEVDLKNSKKLWNDWAEIASLEKVELTN